MSQHHTPRDIRRLEAALAEYEKLCAALQRAARQREEEIARLQHRVAMLECVEDERQRAGRCEGDILRLLTPSAS